MAHPDIWRLRARNNRRRQTEEELKAREDILIADYGMVASTYPGWIQTVFDTMAGLFDQVGLKMNVRKTVGMVCHTFRAARIRADKAYNRMMTGAGRSYKERKRERVSFPDYWKEFERGSLAAYCQTQHGVVKGGLVQEGEG